MKLIDYAGLCALIAVSAVSAAVVIVIVGIVWRDRVLTEHGANALSVAIGGLLALTGTYIGGHLADRKDV